MSSTSPQTDAPGVPLLLVVMASATVLATAIIFASLAVGGWLPMFVALGSVALGAVVTLLAIGRALTDEDGEDVEVRASEPVTPAAAAVPTAIVRDEHAARRRAAAPAPSSRPLARR